MFPFFSSLRRLKCSIFCILTRTTFMKCKQINIFDNLTIKIYNVRVYSTSFGRSLKQATTNANKFVRQECWLSYQRGPWVTQSGLSNAWWIFTKESRPIASFYGRKLTKINILNTKFSYTTASKRVECFVVLLLILVIWALCDRWINRSQLIYICLFVGFVLQLQVSDVKYHAVWPR